MRTYPEDKYDLEELERLGLTKDNWMIKVLKLNPYYISWGNYEDYMCKKNAGWETPVELEAVNQLWELDDLNELVNFYFEVIRKEEKCKSCNGSGLNKETNKILDDWYDFENKGTRWCDNITQDEVQALWDNGRLKPYFKTTPTAKEVNEWSKNVLIHDAINRSICVKQRAKRLGVYGHCEKCKGYGYNFIEEECHLALQMWFIHPRKGCSRGCYLKNITQEELPKVIDYLKEANKRNNERFSKLDISNR